jgi:hypothetical protein
MSSDLIKKKSHTGEEVEVIGPNYEPGKPEGKGDWRLRMENREQMLKYLQSGERYWYAEEGYGSEKRKTPA